MEPSPCCRCTGQGMGWLGLTSRSLATLAACCCLYDSSVLNQITSHSLHHIISVHIMSYHFVSHHITSYTIPYIIPSVPVFYWYCIQFYVCACVSSPFLPMVVVPHVQRWCALHLCDRSPASGAEGENAGGLCYGSWQFQMRSGRQTQGQDIIIRSLSCSLACCLLIKNLTWLWWLLVFERFLWFARVIATCFNVLFPDENLQCFLWEHLCCVPENYAEWIHLRKLCMVASSDWGATTYSPQFVYKASLLSNALHTLWGVKGSHFEAGGEAFGLLRVLSHLLTTYKVFWRLLAAPSRKLTYPTWGKGKSSSNMPYHGGYVNFLEGIFFAWLVLLEGIGRRRAYSTDFAGRA